MKNLKFINSYIKIREKHYENFKKSFKKDFLKKRIKLLKEISEALNSIHNQDYKPNNYKFLIGAWLDDLLKLYLTRKFYNKFNKEKLLVEKKLKINLNNNYSEYISRTNQYNFNLNIFSKLKNVEQKINFKLKKKIIKESIIRKLLKVLILSILKILITKKTTLIINSGFSTNALIKLFFFSKFKVVPFYNLSFVKPKYSFYLDNKHLRKKFYNLIKTKLPRDLSLIIMDTIPSAYVEEFKYYEEKSKKNYQFLPGKVFSKTSHLDDEIFKMTLMRWSKYLNSKPKILILQHGGNYSIGNEYAIGLHDYEISNKYYTWGHKFKKKHFPSYSHQILSKFLLYKKRKNKFKKKYFTFILGPNFKYDFQRYVYHLELYDILYKNRKDLLRHVNNPSNVVFKEYHQKRYMQQDTRREILLNLKINPQNIKRKFDIIFESKVLIFEYFSTLFFETIHFNIPFIFIIDEKNFYFSKIGKDFLNILKKNNLIFSSGVDAANFLNSIDDFDTWWKSIDKKDYLRIKKLLANIHFNDLNYWLQQFKN